MKNCYNNKEVNKLKFREENICTITEANQNFSKVARKIEESGDVVIYKNNRPQYIIIKYSDVKKIKQ